MSSKYRGMGGTIVSTIVSTIVNVSSGAAKSGSPNEYIDYAASKGVIDSLTKGLALEVAAEGIGVNAARPGFIDTDIHAAEGEPNRIERLKSKIPMQRGDASV
jgi:NAD(P)-dependent dehydrogenase (short-subunit alcohol dehydrogenase family)